MAAEEAKAPAASAPKSGGGLVAMLLPLLNTVLVLSVLGLFVYTRVIYKRPAITEKGERIRLAKERAKPTPEPQSGTIAFEPVTANIATTPASAPGSLNPEPVGPKLRYVTFGFTVELRDISHEGRITSLKPLIMDRVLQLMGQKQFHELISIQGRYVLKTEIQDIIQDVALPKEARKSSDALVSQLYFTQFTVQ